MKMTPEMLEILIGKYLDSEITPSEQRLLDAELERDPQVKELLKELQDLHECNTDVITSEIAGTGRAPEDVFERAWLQQSKRPFRFFTERTRTLRFAAGMAAGLVMGLVLHFMLPSISPTPLEPVPTNLIVQNSTNQIEPEEADSPTLMTDQDRNIFRNVDWYNFTDKEGNQWLIEGLRENIVRPASYSEDL